jgi:hypothetical protein
MASSILELGESLLQFLTIVIGPGIIDLCPDLLDAALNCRLRPGALDDK